LLIFLTFKNKKILTLNPFCYRIDLNQRAKRVIIKKSSNLEKEIQAFKNQNIKNYTSWNILKSLKPEIYWLFKYAFL